MKVFSHLVLCDSRGLIAVGMATVARFAALSIISLYRPMVVLVVLECPLYSMCTYAYVYIFYNSDLPNSYSARARTQIYNTAVQDLLRDKFGRKFRKCRIGTSNQTFSHIVCLLCTDCAQRETRFGLF